MQSLTGFIREPDEDPLYKRAREIISAIDEETGSRTAQQARVERLYNVARDIQRYYGLRGGVKAVHRVVAFLADVFAKAYLPRLAR